MRCLGVVGGRGDVSTMACPVGVDELARLGEELVGVGTEVVTLGLDEVGRDTG